MALGMGWFCSEVVRMVGKGWGMGWLVARGKDGWEMDDFVTRTVFNPMWSNN